MGTKVVILEDDANNLGLFRAILLRAGYEPLPAESCWDVQEQCATGAQVLIADLFLLAHPCCHGTDVALRTVELHPAVKVLFVSGTPLELWSETDLRNMAMLPDPSVDFLVKPFTAPALVAKLKELLSRPALEVSVHCPHHP